MTAKRRQLKLPSGPRPVFVYPVPEPPVYERARQILATRALPAILLVGTVILLLTSPGFAGAIAIMSGMTFAVILTLVAIAFLQR